MAISDFISTSFLFSIAIIVILIGGIFAYVSYRMSEQDHKFSSMLGLVTTMADEIHELKYKAVVPVNQQQQQQQQDENLEYVDINTGEPRRVNVNNPVECATQ